MWTTPWMISNDFLGPSFPDREGGGPKLVSGAFETLPEYCRAWRLVSKITQGQIAERVGVNRSNVSRFEEGRIQSNKILAGYAGLGMPLPYDLVIKYFEGDNHA